MGRYQARDIYEEEYEADERTCAAVGSTPPSYDDQFEDRTRSARESYVALEGIENRSGERASVRPSARDSQAPEGRYSHVAASEIARRSFVAPAEIEGERSPAMRARRQSFVDQSELLPTPVRPSHVAASERPRASHVAASERPRASHVAASERPSAMPGPLPTPPRSGRRNSYVASSERADFASSVPDAEEVTSYREPPRASKRPSQHPVREESYAPAIESGEIEEVVSKQPERSERRSKRPSQPAPEERSRPVDYEALKQYLFADVAPSSAEAAAMSAEDRSVSMQTPVATFDPRAKATNKAFRPAMHSMAPHSMPLSTPPSRPASRPEIAPAARISHNAFRPQLVTGPQLSTVPPHFRQPMMTGPQFPGAQAPVGNDSYVDSSWIVPTPQFPANTAPATESGGFKITFAFIAAALTAIAALTVMVGAIVFIRSEDAPLMTPGPITDAVKTDTAKADKPVEKPVVAPVVVVAPVIAEKKAEKPVVAEKKTEKPVVVAEKKTEKPVVAEKLVAKKKPAAVPTTSNDDDEDDAPPPPKKTAKKTASDKTVEAMLADLQEQQLNR